MTQITEPVITEAAMTRFVRDCTFVLIGMLLGAISAVLGIGFGMGIF